MQLQQFNRELAAKSACVLVVVSRVFDMYIHKDSMRSWTETCWKPSK